MIRGLEKFKDFFRDFQGQYVLIGGSACDILFEEAGIPFRATRDIDMVLIVEALTPEFGRRFWDFIEAGGYEHRARSNGAPQYYRFDRPQEAEFPLMLELFSRAAPIPDNRESQCIPLHLGEDLSSLSAILLDEDYYRLLLDGKSIRSDVVVLTPVYLILFKAKAWLDLTERQKGGQKVDTKDIKKHKNDIVRLAGVLTGEEKIALPESVRVDMRGFLERFEAEPTDMKNMGLPALTFAEVLRLLKAIYL